MRRLLTLSLMFAIILEAGLLIFYPNSWPAHYNLILIAVLVIAVVVERSLNLFPPRKRRTPPPSKIAEMERLYFRAMREMLTQQPNLVQVITDLNQVLVIDSRYKNARHYLSRALVMQQHEQTAAGQGSQPRRPDFQALQEKLVDPDAGVRKSIVMDLIPFGEAAVDPLIALLMDEDADVRVHAATALGWVGGDDAVMPLLVALNDEHTHVRRYAARALCWVVNETAVAELIAALKDDDSYVRSYVARALGWSQDQRAVHPLIELLDDENADVRGYAITALDDLGFDNTHILDTQNMPKVLAE